ncbi:replication initiator protein [Flyfo microvirus Tbat2_91]|nr:replication initiator protein [Flyfo microvirus Tbat2_91]
MLKHAHTIGILYVCACGYSPLCICAFTDYALKRNANLCLAPPIFRDGTQGVCRKCWQCRQNRIDHWVGRCIAESKTSVAATALELTYGRDEEGNESHARAAILTYSDVQKYFKQLRNRGFPCRYFITGEHGSKKGRAHWHAIVFWREGIPRSMTDYGGNSWHRAIRDIPVEVPIEWNTRFNEPCWTHGFSFWRTLASGYERGSVAYVCKYINKDVDDPTSQSKLAMSKKPPIGSDYFIQRAQKFVDQRIAPQDGLYQFPDEARRKDGKPVTFKLAGKIEEIFCQAFVEKWAEQVGGHMPPSQYIDDYLDGKFRDESGDFEYVGAGRYILNPGENIGANIPWRDEDKIDVIDPHKDQYPQIPPAAAGRLKVENRTEPKPRLTQLGWVEKLSERNVFWITSAAPSGRYKNRNGIWMRSLM